jgi:hypothetical protein
MIEEPSPELIAEIEKMYSKQLKTWAVKWNNLIEKGKDH